MIEDARWRWDDQRQAWEDLRAGGFYDHYADGRIVPRVRHPHGYLSTACYHARLDGSVQHDRCRLVCKFCSAPCACPCHDEEG